MLQQSILCAMWQGGLSTKFIRLALMCILVWTSFELAQAEKEPVDEDLILKSDKPPLMRGHTFDNTEVSTDGEPDGKSNLGFIHAFVAALSVIIVSELGDKTFFIAAIMAMRHPRFTVFLGAIAALALMTVLSVFFGYAATIIPRAYTYYISTFLFALFGLKMLKDGYYMSPTEGQEELEEVQQDLRKREDEVHFDSDQWDNPKLCGKRKLKRGAVPTLFNNIVPTSDNNNFNAQGHVPKKRTIVDSVDNDHIQASTSNTERLNVDEPNNEVNDQLAQTLPENLITNNNTYEREAATTLLQDPESGVIRKTTKAGSSVLGSISRIFIQSFTLTFLAEWGDRSQLTTIILAAREDVVGVTVGGVLGHALCTGLAVMGGRMIAQRISVRTVTLIGGVVFIMFAITALFFDPNAE